MRAALRAVLLRGASTGLDLNFAGGVFSLNNLNTSNPANIPGWSFSRTDTNGTATALDLAGNVIQFATGVPRITNRGILVEEARTNLLERSTAFDNAYWSKARATITANTTVAPDGTTTANSLVEDTTSNSHPVFRTVGSLANATAYTWSVFVAPLGRTSCNLAASNTAFGTPGNATFSLSGAGSVSASSGCTAVIQAVAGGFYRCSITLTTVSAGNGDVYVQPFNGGTSYLGNGAAALAIWGAQLELGAFATSPIITTGAAGTRDGEVVSLGTAALPPEGTIILTYVVQPTAVGTAARTYGFHLTDAGNSRFSLRIGDSGLATTPVAIVGDGAALTTLTGSSLTPGTTAKVAVSYSSLSAQFAMAVNGSDQTGARQAVAATLALTFRLGSIGTPGTNAINSPIARAQIIPRFLTAAERIALTAP